MKSPSNSADSARKRSSGSAGNARLRQRGVDCDGIDA